jgi:hypothetical protein
MKLEIVRAKDKDWKIDRYLITSEYQKDKLKSVCEIVSVLECEMSWQDYIKTLKLTKSEMVDVFDMLEDLFLKK